MRKNWKILTALMLIVIFGFAFAGCKNVDNAVEDQKADSNVVENQNDVKEPIAVTDNPGMADWPEGEVSEEPLNICVLQHDASNEYQKIMWNAFQAYLQPLADAGQIEYFTLDGKGDVATQVSNIETAITKGADGILAITQDLNSNDAALNAAIDAGIVVVTYNTRVTSVEDYPFVASSDYEEGQVQARYLAEDLEDGAKIAYIYGFDGSDCAINRFNGFNDTLKELCPNTEIVDQQTCNWARDKGMAIAEDWLIKYSDLDAIVCCNDASALGAIEACKNAGRLYRDGDAEESSKIKIYSIDGVAEGITAVANGELRCTVFQDAIAAATNSAKICIEMIRGVYDGETEVMIPPELVTTENAESFKLRNTV